VSFVTEHEAQVGGEGGVRRRAPKSPADPVEIPHQTPAHELRTENLVACSVHGQSFYALKDVVGQVKV
jgi:hypothetical protein